LGVGMWVMLIYCYLAGENHCVLCGMLKKRVADLNEQKYLSEHMSRILYFNILLH
jgi:hypothetical protein